MNSNQEITTLAGLIRQYPELAWAAIVFGGVVIVTMNFAWWLVELPGLINAHNDSRLLAAFAGSLGLVLFDVVTIVRVARSTIRMLSAINSTGNDHDDEV